MGMSGVRIVLHYLDISGAGGCSVCGILCDTLSVCDCAGDCCDGAIFADGLEVVESRDYRSGGGDGHLDYTRSCVGDVLVFGGAADIAELDQIVTAIVEPGLPEGGVTVHLCRGRRGGLRGGKGRVLSVNDKGGKRHGGEGERGCDGGSRFHDGQWVLELVAA